MHKESFLLLFLLNKVQFEKLVNYIIENIFVLFFFNYEFLLKKII